MSDRIWPHWEDWEQGWEVIDDRLHFEGEDIEHMLPMHLPTEITAEFGPPVWTLRYPFENGWEAFVTHESFLSSSVLPNDAGAATFVAINRRLAGPGRWLATEQYDDPGLAWPVQVSNNEWETYEMASALDDPDILVLLMDQAMRLPSDHVENVHMFNAKERLVRRPA